MRLKRYFLISISVAFLLWAVCFLGGPVIIKSIVKSKFNSEILLHSVKVTPTLNVYIGRVEFRDFNYMSGRKISGFARQVKLDWSLISSNKLASLKWAAINLEDRFIFDKSVVIIYKGDFWDFNVFRVSSSIPLMKIAGIGAAERVDINAIWDRSGMKLSQISTKLPTVILEGDRDVMLTDVSINLDTIDLSSDLRDQTNNLEIVSTELKTTDDYIRLNGALTTVKNRMGELKAVSSLSGLSANEGIFSSDTLDVHFEAKIDEMLNFESISSASRISLVLDGVSYNKTKAKILEIEMSLKSAKNPWVLEVSSRATDLFLETADFFIGELAFISMTNSMLLDAQSLDSSFKGNVDSSLLIEKPKEVAAKIKSEFTTGKTLRECLTGSCSLNEGFINYLVSAADTNLFGLVNCSYSPCNMSNVDHAVETNNTNEFFRNIIESRLFNPILILYIQSTIMSGKVSGSGHQKILQ